MILTLLAVAIAVFSSGYLAGVCKEKKYSKKKSFFSGFSLGIILFTFFIINELLKYSSLGDDFDISRFINGGLIGFLVSVLMGIRCAYPDLQ